MMLGVIGRALCGLVADIDSRFLQFGSRKVMYRSPLLHQHDAEDDQQGQRQDGGPGRGRFRVVVEQVAGVVGRSAGAITQP